MNYSVDIARDVCKAPESYDQNLLQMLKELINNDVPVKVRGTGMARCGNIKTVHILPEQKNQR